MFGSVYKPNTLHNDYSNGTDIDASLMMQLCTPPKMQLGYNEYLPLEDMRFFIDPVKVRAIFLNLLRRTEFTNFKITDDIPEKLAVIHGSATVHGVDCSSGVDFVKMSVWDLYTTC